MRRHLSASDCRDTDDDDECTFVDGAVNLTNVSDRIVVSRWFECGADLVPIFFVAFGKQQQQREARAGALI